MLTRRSHVRLLVLLAALAALTPSNASAAVIWVNETNLGSEADFAVLQFPTSTDAAAGALTEFIYGQIYELGKTEGAGPNASILADVGFGTLGSDPRFDASWLWTAATFNVQVGNNDEYQAKFVAPLVNGSYSYTFRFSTDGGATYTAADLNGAGSNAGLTFDVSQLGTLRVTGGTDATPVPEPATLGLVSLGALALRLRRRGRSRRI